jgi:hypothetical protein
MLGDDKNNIQTYMTLLNPQMAHVDYQGNHAPPKPWQSSKVVETLTWKAFILALIYFTLNIYLFWFLVILVLLWVQT